jgi:hypothetical protein
MSEEAYGSFKRWETERNRAQELEKRAADLAHEIILLQYKVIDKDKKIAELEAQNVELEGALLRQTVIVRYYAGDFVCECGWVVDDDDPQIKFNYCAGCGAELDWSEVEK